MKTQPQLVWFKRDLRTYDHAPLLRARNFGRVVGIYIWEPELYAAEDYGRCHADFVRDALADLRTRLAELGIPLLIAHGEACSVLARIIERLGISRVWSHQETGNAISFARDLRVANFLRQRSLAWIEIPQPGVVRGLKDRSHWSDQWHASMLSPCLPVPRPQNPLVLNITDESPPPHPDAPKTMAQKGGRSEAENCLASFFADRGRFYSREMSSPLTAFESCSRLSPYFAYGCLSVREVFQRLQAEKSQHFANPEPGRGASLMAFGSRLRWQAHFIQKLETEPRIEYENLNRGFDGMRENEFNRSYFLAWQKGETGFPMIDASMKALQEHGWINFRMRAMLVSFASYQLWLDWRPTSRFLARHFTDYEPGIHYSQFQMQSGTTGINTLRIYSPFKQHKDQDPEHMFIRKYCPALKNVPDEWMFEPSLMPISVQRSSGCIIGRDYPAPIIDHEIAFKLAKDRAYAWKKSDEARHERAAILLQHVGPESKRRRTGKPRAKTTHRSQKSSP